MIRGRKKLMPIERRRLRQVFCDNQNKRYGVKIKEPIVCEDCGRKSIVEAHYENYRRPLAVRLICSRCHNTRHNGTTEERRLLKELHLLRNPVPLINEKRGPRKKKKLRVGEQCPPCRAGCCLKCTGDCRCKNCKEL